MGHKQWPSCQVTDSSLSFVGLSSARTGPCRQRRTAAKAVPAPARSIRPLGHAKTVLNIGHFGACLAIFHSVCQKGTGGKCLNIRKHRVSLSHRAWLAVSHQLHDPTQASNPQHVQTRLHRHPIYVLASRMTNTDVCISQGVHIVVACVHCTKGESNRTTTMLSCTLCICPHPQQAPACYTQVIDMCVATKAVHMRARCA